MKKIPIDHDTRWKVLITALFQDFVAFFLPDVYSLVDWNKPYVSLDKELHKLVADKYKGGKVESDKLFKVYLKGGGEELLLIHVEVESSGKPNIDERMFVYFYRIFDTFGKVVTALAVFASDSLPKNYSRFEYEKLGTKATYEYNTFVLKDVSEEKLLASENPFALALLAVKYLNLSKNEDELRYDFKSKLYELALERGYTSKQIFALLRFIDFLLILPGDLETKFRTDMENTHVEQPEFNEYEMEVGKIIFKSRFGVSVDEYGEVLAREIQEKVEREIQEKVEREIQEVTEKAEKSVREAVEKAENAIKNMLTNTDLSVQQIAEIQGVTEQKVLDIQAKINGK